MPTGIDLRQWRSGRCCGTCVFWNPTRDIGKAWTPGQCNATVPFWVAFNIGYREKQVADFDGESCEAWQGKLPDPMSAPSPSGAPGKAARD